MGNVMLIPARRQVGSNARKQEEEKPKLRVAAYCRVSTDSDEQATSYEAQVEHYTEYIQKNPTAILRYSISLQSNREVDMFPYKKTELSARLL